MKEKMAAKQKEIEQKVEALNNKTMKEHENQDISLDIEMKGTTTGIKPSE